MKNHPFIIPLLTFFLFLPTTVEIQAQTEKEILDSTLTAPPVLTDPPARYNDENRDYNMNCGIAQTPGGRLWACSISGGDSPAGYLVCFSSDDDGKSWSKPRLVIDPEDYPNGVRRRILIANFWTDPQGKLWLFFDYGLGMFDGRVGLWAMSCNNPDDVHPVWSEPKRISHGSLHNKLLVLKDGTWILPVELYARAYSAWCFKHVAKNHQGFPELDEYRGITLLASNNNGQSWEVRGRCRFPVSEGEEPICLEKKDGTLWLLARTPKGMHQSFSTDSGRTWSTPIPAIKNPVTRFFVTRLKSGNLLLVRHGSVNGEETKRTRLTACLSDDDGKTWKGGLLLDERNSVSYPDGFQAEDGRIYITYDRERSGAAEILLAVFKEADILAEKPVSPETRLKVLVSKGQKGKEKKQKKVTAPPKVSKQYSVFPANPKLKKNKTVVLVSGDEEYRSEEELQQLGKILAQRQGFDTVVLYAIDSKTGLITPTVLNNIPGLENLRRADLLILATRFRNLPDQQMKEFNAYLLSGRPVIGLRTATHAFNLDKKSPWYYYTWNAKGIKPGWDGGFGRKILGETWVNHHGHHGVEGTRAVPVPEEKDCPVLRGVSNIVLKTDVYTVRLRPEDQCRVILHGQVISGFNATDPPVAGKKNDPMMPVAWFKSYQLEGGKEGRVFTSTMGSGQDLLNEGFRRLLVNAVYDLLSLDVPQKANVELVGDYTPLHYGFGKFKPNLVP